MGDGAEEGILCYREGPVEVLRLTVGGGDGGVVGQVGGGAADQGREVELDLWIDELL